MGMVTDEGKKERIFARTVEGIKNASMGLVKFGIYSLPYASDTKLGQRITRNVKYKGQDTILDNEQYGEFSKVERENSREIAKLLGGLVLGGLLCVPQIKYKTEVDNIYNHLKGNHKVEYALLQNSRSLYSKLDFIGEETVGDEELEVAKRNLEERTNSLFASLDKEDNPLKEPCKEYVLDTRASVGNFYSAMGMMFGAGIACVSLLGLILRDGYSDKKDRLLVSFFGDGNESVEVPRK